MSIRPDGRRYSSPPEKEDNWAIRVRLQISNRVRDLALFNLAIDSKLRGCDLVHLRVEDVMQADQVRTRALVSQRKTGAPVQFEITEQARAAIAYWVRGKNLKGSEWLFPSRVDRTQLMTTLQYGRLVDEWIAAIGLAPSAYGTHSLRRPKAALIYRKTGNIRAVQLLLGHTKLDSTVRYLGVELEDALAIAESIDVEPLALA
ncbi:MAG: tyrosine-type recombinase/integrase [Hyphomonadaceae bacterium]|nr:tyrosine-type recombinase/integrase [Hyphomonadaceae bacterium]